MSDAGYIYVLMNPSMEGIYKVGKTNAPPEEWIKELSVTTDVQTPFTCVYEEYFPNCSKAEEYLHATLESRGNRISENRDLFKANLKDIIASILEVKQTSPKRGDNIKSEINDPVDIFSFPEGNEEFLDSLDIDEDNSCGMQDFFQMADNYYNEHSDFIEDPAETMEHYKQASWAGSAEAHLKLGEMYQRGEVCVKNIKKSLEHYKSAVSLSNYKGYAKMALLFDYCDVPNKVNAHKCYVKYLDNLLQVDQQNDITYLLGCYIFHEEEHTFNLSDEQRAKILERGNSILGLLGKRIRYAQERGHAFLVEYYNFFSIKLEKDLGLNC